jgi:hypothetical protein
MYQEYLRVHEEELQKKLDAEKAIQSGFIPSGGALITCMMQVNDTSSPGKTKQVRLPYEALYWLIGRLEAQGSSLDALQSTNQQVPRDLVQNQASSQPTQGLSEPQGAMMPLQTMQ